MKFENPWVLTLLILLPLWGWFLTRQKKTKGLQFPGYYHLDPSFFLKSWIPRILWWLRGLSLALIILALARPQTGRSFTEESTHGIDMMLAIDTSGSMEALDLQWQGKAVTRLEVVQHVLAEFIRNRPHDRLGMVVFGDEAFTQAPLTQDGELLLSFLDQTFIGMAGKATAIGSAIAVGSKRLKDLSAKSKILILLTDGENTAGQVDPLHAAEAAKALGIKIYTIGVGTEGNAPFLVNGLFGQQVVYQPVSIDDKTLQKIADITGGRYFRANDTKALQEVYHTINQLEKTEAKLKDYHEYQEKFIWFLIPSLMCFLLEWLLRQTRLREIP